MPKRYKYPPLVELVAEVRWGPGGPPPSVGSIVLAASQYEEFFMRFGSKVATLGYDRFERLVPPGFSSLPFQAIYRFRKEENEQGSTIYQVGAGVFTANITPPYHSWKQFRPVVERGVELLLETRNESERETPFSLTTLRYIDAFGSIFTQGSSVARFVQDILGFSISLPAPVRSEMAPDAEAKPSLQLAIPLKSSQVMALALAEGTIGGERTVIMDIFVTNESQIAANKDDVMASFDTAHDAIHRVFVGVTEKLSDIMEPIEGDDT
jgi:uncharacterized protein (TIGR04255 family)